MDFAVVRKPFADAVEEGGHELKKDAKKQLKEAKKEIKNEAEEELPDLTEVRHEIKVAKKDVKKIKKEIAGGTEGATTTGSGILHRLKRRPASSVSPRGGRTSRSTSSIGEDEQDAVPPLPLQLGKAAKQGYLTKQGQKVKSWRERWFKLDDLGCLHYYKTPNDANPLDSLWLEGAEVRVEEGLKRAGYNFSVLLVQPKPRVLYLSAKTADERREWMEAILEGCNYAQCMLSSSPRESLHISTPKAEEDNYAVSQREYSTVDIPDIRDEGSDEDEVGQEEEDKALSAKTLLSQSMWGPADMETSSPQDTTAFTSWYGVVGMTIGGGGNTNVNRDAVVADGSEGMFAWCTLRLRGRISVIGKEEVMKTDDPVELEQIKQTLTSPVKQFLCENKEGWMFYAYVSPAQQQTLGKKGRHTFSMPRMKMAADTKREMEDWAGFLWDRGLAGRQKQMINGFLWIRKNKAWQRYYCIADPHYFEWFELQKFRAVPIASLVVSGLVASRSEVPGRAGRSKQKSSSYHVRNVLENYHRKLVVNDGKKSICLYTADDDHCNYWRRVLSSPAPSAPATPSGREVLMLSCAAGYAGAAVNGNAAVPVEKEQKNSLMNEQQGSAKGNTLRSTSPLTELINSARLLCEKANQATGKSSLGNYPVENIGSKDGHYRILSLDGGGLRAVMEAVILARLTEVYPDLLQKFDLIVGVSGGSMVTAGLAVGRSPQFLTEMFKVIGPICFRQKAASVQWFSLNQAKFPREPLEVFGAEVFKGMTLRELPRRVVITSFLLDNEAEGNNRSWEPRIYHNLPMKPEYEKKEGAWKDQELWKCVLSSSAAPIYFPTHGKHIDGAVMVNNPALSALSMVMSEKVIERQDPARIHLLSLGTGRMVQFIEGDNLDWGMIQWAPKLPELIVKAGLLHQEEMVRLMLGERFHQCNPLMEKFLDMDNPAIIPDLINLAQRVDLSETIAWIDLHIYGGTAAVGGGSAAAGGPKASSASNASRGPPKDLSCDLSAFYSAPLQMSNDEL